jgi:hypothetical protein
MSEDTKTFDLGTVLSVTTEKLLTNIGNLYDILGWMTEDEPFTHQLPRFNEECKPWLLRQYPQLSAVDASGVTPDNWGDFLQRHKALLGDSFEVERIPRDDHTRKNALVEAVEMFGKDKVIPLVIPDKTSTEQSGQ